MCAKLLNTEEIAKLKLNSYVVDATERFVYFTIEFKKQFYKVLHTPITDFHRQVNRHAWHTHEKARW